MKIVYIVLSFIIICLMVGCSEKVKEEIKQESNQVSIPQPQPTPSISNVQPPQIQAPIRNARTVMTEAKKLYIEGNYTEAKKLFQEARQLGSNDATTWITACNERLKDADPTVQKQREETLTIETEEASTSAWQPLALSYAKAWVLAHLKAPKSAVFDTINCRATGKSEYLVTGLISALNPMGVELTSSFNVRVKITGKWEREEYVPDRFDVTGTIN